MIDPRPNCGFWKEDILTIVTKAQFMPTADITEKIRRKYNEKTVIRPRVLKRL